MKDIAIQRLDENRYRLAGSITFATVTAAYQNEDLDLTSRDGIEIDLTDVSRVDSAGLALLLEWIRAAGASGGRVRFTSIPVQLERLIQVAGLEEVFAGAELMTNGTT